MEKDTTVRMFKSLLQGHCSCFTTTYPKLNENTNCIKVVCNPKINYAIQGRGAHLMICRDKETNETTHIEASMNF